MLLALELARTPLQLNFKGLTKRRANATSLNCLFLVGVSDFGFWRNLSEVDRFGGHGRRGKAKALNVYALWQPY